MLEGVMSAVLDYPTWFELVPAFTSSEGDLNALKNIVKKSQGTYASGAFMTGSFLENHDQPRFGSRTSDAAVRAPLNRTSSCQLKCLAQLRANAIVWPFIHDGIPTLYYGKLLSYEAG